MASLVQTPRTGKFIETDRSCDSVSNNKNVLKMDRGEVCTLLSMHLEPLNHTLKMVKLAGLMYIFHNKKYLHKYFICSKKANQSSLIITVLLWWMSVPKVTGRLAGIKVLYKHSLFWPRPVAHRRLQPRTQ